MATKTKAKTDNEKEKLATEASVLGGALKNYDLVQKRTIQLPDPQITKDRLEDNGYEEVNLSPVKFPVGHRLVRSVNGVRFVFTIGAVNKVPKNMVADLLLEAQGFVSKKDVKRNSDFDIHIKAKKRQQKEAEQTITGEPMIVGKAPKPESVYS